MMANNNVLTVKLPSNFDTDGIHDFLQNTFDHNKKPLERQVIFDLEPLTFITPSGVTVLAIVTDYLVDLGCSVQYRYDNDYNHPSHHALKYLNDSGYFSYFFGRDFFPDAQCRSTTVPLKAIAHEDYFSWLTYIVMPWLDNRLSIKTDLQFPEFHVCLDEVFNNVKDHSGAKKAYAFMQHFPRKNEVHIAISDFGIGIPKKVRQKVSVDDDGIALLIAIAEGFTTKSVPGNRGAGLDNLIFNVVNNNKGTVSILAGFGTLHCSLNSGNIEHIAKKTDTPYPGTFLDIKIRTNNIKDEISAKEDFLW